MTRIAIFIRNLLSSLSLELKLNPSYFLKNSDICDYLLGNTASNVRMVVLHLELSTDSL
jgi:hypothetical protein